MNCRSSRPSSVGRNGRRPAPSTSPSCWEVRASAAAGPSLLRRDMTSPLSGARRPCPVGRPPGRGKDLRAGAVKRSRPGASPPYRSPPHRGLEHHPDFALFGGPRTGPSTLSRHYSWRPRASAGDRKPTANPRRGPQPGP
jgi:hypothetical protein